MKLWINKFIQGCHLVPRKLLLSFFCLIISYLLFRWNIVSSDKPTHPEIKLSNYYLEKVDLFTRLNSFNGEVIFFGDSLTDNAEWHELFPGTNVSNRGIQGDTVDGLINRLSNVINTRAEKVFLMIGINDLRRNVKAKFIFTSLDKLVTELSFHHKSVYVQSTLFVRSKDMSINKKVAVLNEHLKFLTSQYENTVFIDLNKKLSKDGQLAEGYTYDGIHLNGAGYLKWRDVILKHVVP